MAKKVNALKEYEKAQEQLAKVAATKAKAEKKVLAAWKDYLKSIQEAVVEEMKSLTWQRFKGRGSKSEVEAVIEEKDSTLYKLSDMESRSPGHRWYGLAFSDKDGYELFRIKFCSPNYSNKYKLTVRVSIAQLKSLGVVPEVADKKRKAAVRKIVEQAGLDERQVQEAINLYNRQQAEKKS